MTVESSRQADARIPVVVPELYLDTCAYEYGKSVTNLLTYSEQIDHADWAKTRLTISANSIIAPDGISTADKISADATTNTHFVLQDRSVTNTLTYTQSVYAKKGEYKYLQIATSTGFASDYRNFNLENGVVAGGALDARIEDVGNGWFRCSVTAIATSTVSGRFIFSPYNTDALRLASYLGDDVSGVYIWGVQLVNGNKAGHYVKTTTVSATGSCDATAAKANLFTRAEEFDHVDWAKTETTITANTRTAPDGKITADKLVSAATALSHYISQNNSVTSGIVYTQSIYAKKGEYEYLQIATSAGFASAYRNFNLDTGTLAGGDIGGSIEDIGNGWYRCSVTATATSTISGRMVISYAPTDITRLTAYTGDGTSGLYAWGAQFVNGDKAGIYYKTEATAHSGTVGAECYNTFITCEDIPNFTKHLKTYRFYQPVSNWPKGQIGFPAVKGKPRFTPCQIDPRGSLGKRGSVSIVLNDFADDDLFTDPYATTRTYDPETQGTFFGKLKSRSPYYKGRLMKVRQGYINTPFSFDDFEDRLYVIESIKIDQRAGTATIVGKDLLKLTDSAKAKAPVADTGTLFAAMTAGQTTAILQTGEGTDYDTDPYTGSAISGSILGYAMIGDELVSFTGISTDTITGITRALQGTTAETHDIDENVQLCLHFENVNVLDIINYLLKTGAWITESYIPYDAGLTTPTGTNDEWDVEHDSWLSSNDLTYTVIEPTGINKLLKQICEQNLIYMWFNEIDQEIKLRAIAPALRNETPPTLTDAANIVADSVRVKDNEAGRISEVWVHYGIIDITDKLDKASNYRNHKIVIDTESEGVNAYAEKAIRVIYANWLSAANAGLILTLAGRLLSRYSGTPQFIDFKIDTKDANIWTGSSINLDTLAFQDFDGSNRIQSMQVLKAFDDHDKQMVDLTAESWDYDFYRYAFIAANSMGDYTAESEANQAAYGFISQNDGYYTDGSIGHLIA